MENHGAITFILISFSFYLARSRMILFNVITGIVLAVFVVLSRDSFLSRDEIGLSFLGLLLYWFGLLSVRTMLRRSVSLSLLANHTSGEATQRIREEIGNRLNDLKYYRLAREEDRRYRLTWFGKLIGAVVSVSYFIFRVK